MVSSKFFRKLFCWHRWQTLYIHELPNKEVMFYQVCMKKCKSKRLISENQLLKLPILKFKEERGRLGILPTLQRLVDQKISLLCESITKKQKFVGAEE